jgi:hypothetical protein
MVDGDELLSKFQPQSMQVINEFEQFVLANFDQMDENKDAKNQCR